jgi:hypothetical protein
MKPDFFSRGKGFPFFTQLVMVKLKMSLVK